MKLTWTFYPKGASESVSLTVIYVPALDAEKLSSGGYLHPLSNTAYVDWLTYKRFDSADIANRRDAFQNLINLGEQTEIIIGRKAIPFPR